MHAVAKKLLLFGLFLVCCIGLYVGLTRTPAAPSGTVTLIMENRSEDLTGYLTVRKFRDDTTEYDLPVIKRLAKLLPEASQPLPTDSQNTLSAVNLRFTGEQYGVPTYTIYSPDGEKLSDKSESLVLPAGTHRDFVVRVSVRWGKENNYALTDYYFRVVLSDSESTAQKKT